MVLQQVTDEKDLQDGRTYLCCRSSRHGNAIWQTMEAQKHQLLCQNLKLPLSAFAKIYHLPKTVAGVDAEHSEP